MSYYDTKQALIKRLLDASIVDSNNIAFENDEFNPANKNVWLAVYFIPATTDSLGKTSSDFDDQRGIFQISVYVKKNTGEYDNLQIQTIDSIKSAFRYNDQLVYNTQTVSVLNSTTNNGIEVESWFKRDVSINYLTFSQR